METAATTASLVIGIVFARAAAAKVVNPRAFARSLSAFDIAPPQMSYLIGLSLIPLEVIIAASHLTGVGLVAGNLLTIVVLLLFTIAVTKTLAGGRVIPCNCFGGREEVSLETAVRLALLMAAEVVVILGRSELITLEIWTSDNVVRATLVLIVSVWCLAIRDLKEVFGGCATCTSRSTERHA